MSLAWAMVESNPLNMLPAEHSERMMRLMHRRRLSPGERLEMGKTAGGWWIVENGLMKMYQVAPDGSSLTYALLKPGDSFGETDILTGHWVRAMVEALEPSTVRYLPAEQFHRLLRESPDFALALLRVMAERIRQSQERVFHISRLPLTHRLAHALLGLAESVGKPHPLGTEIHLTQQELADYVGATREAVSRTLSGWSRQGCLETHRKSIILKDTRPLQTLCEQISMFA
ncbi:MAG: Crp/Fnr family transcriptional regulator [Armatimonadota bacterium]|nr:Crp/Fnr family transcriptional regulator [bacterium]MDW8289599.1 Crp/Fnr family transcriptional regulator [Armatimonadota bacterium]